MKRMLSRIPNIALLLLLLLGISLGSGCGGSSVLTIAFTTSPQILDAGRASHFITIQIQDAKGSPNNLKTDTVFDLTSTSSTGRFDTNPSGPFNGSITSVTIPDGSASVNFYYRDTTAGSPTITVAESPSQGWIAETQVEVVNAGILDHFSFAAISNQTENVAFSISITARDVYGNTVTSYTGTNTLSDTTGTISPVTTGAFTGGIWTGDITIASVQSGVTMTASGGGKSGVSNAFDIVAAIVGAGNKLAFTTTPQTTDAGNVSGIITLQTQDASGNLYNVTADTVINLTSNSTNGTFYSDAEGSNPITQVTIKAGESSANFYYKDITAGSPTITLAESPSQGWTAATQVQVVNAGVLDHFSFTTISNQTENVAFGISITAQDVYGNTVTSYTDTNTLSDTTGTISPVTTGAFTGGIWTGNITSASVQSGVTMTTSGGGKSGVSNAFDIVAVVAVASTKLAFTTTTQTIDAGNVSGIITLQAQDASSNPYNVTADTVINLTSSSANGTFYSDAEGLNPITLVTIKAGESSASFYYKDITSGSPTIILAESPPQGWTAVTQAEVINTVTVTKLSFITNLQNIDVGTVSGIITLQTQDASSNPYNVTTDTVINLTTDSTNGTFYSDAKGLNPITLLTIKAGESSASFYYKDTTAGSPTITVSELPSHGWKAANQRVTINPATPASTSSETGLPLFVVILIGAGGIILGILAGYFIFFRTKLATTGKKKEMEIKTEPISTTAQKKAEIEAKRQEKEREEARKKAEIEAKRQEQEREETRKKAEIEAKSQEQEREEAQKKAEIEAKRQEQASELLQEIETNRRIATASGTENLIAFQTQIWDFKHDVVNSLPANIRENLTKAYTDIYQANSVVWLTTQLGRRSPNLDDNYAKLCKSIADQLDLVRQLMGQS